MDDRDYYDDLGGAYYFADDKQSFEPRTPKTGGSGCVFVLVVITMALIAALFIGMSA